jgi:hypothetical protein
MMLARRASGRSASNDISLVLLSAFLNNFFEPTSAPATIENHLEMLLVAGILSPNTTKIKPPTVTNQPRMK